MLGVTRPYPLGRETVSPKNPLSRAIEGGDWEFLAAHIEAGGSIDTVPGLRKFIGMIIRGEAKRKRNRPPGLRTEAHRYRVAQFMDHGGKIEEAMERFHMDRTTVQRAVKAYKDKLAKDPQSIISLWLYQRGYY